MGEYISNPRNHLPNGLTLLQVNPDVAARLFPNDAKDHGWLFRKHHPGGQWVTYRKMSGCELDQAYDQAADMKVLQGTKVRIA
jgi:hypothetical protein